MNLGQNEDVLAPDWIRHHALVTPSAVACEDFQSGRAYTYRQLHQRVGRLAAALQKRLQGAKGERIAVLSRNDSDVFEIQFACQRASAIFVPLNWRLSTAELQAITADARPAVLIHGAEFAETAAQLCSSVPIAWRLETRNGAPSSFESAIAEAEGMVEGSTVRASDPWALIYTSGTTGTPKGVQVSYRMNLCNAVSLGAAFHVTSATCNVVALPTFHTGGLNVFANPTFFHGGTNVVLREFDPGAVIELIVTRRITHMLVVPTMHAMLSSHPDFGALARSSLEGLSVAGAACPISIIEAYAALGLPLRQCWGMTEAGPLATVFPKAFPRDKLGSSGVPIMFVDAMIADADGNPIDDGSVGELLVRGASVTAGYWKRPEANSAAFTREGWFRTGDAAYRDADGYYYIVDRWKDMFISGGENIYPAEIERVLRTADGVADCAVIGVPDEKWGEVGCAFVIPQKGAVVDAAALARYCERYLARYKIPKKFVSVNELPQSATGKVLKGRLRQHELG